MSGDRVASRVGPVDREVVDALVASGPLPDAARRVLQAVAEVLGWQRAELWAVTSTAEVLEMVASWSSEAVRSTPFGESTLGRTFAIGHGLPGRLWAAREPVWIDDVHSTPWFTRQGPAAAAGLRSALGFPVFDRETVCGVVALLGEGDKRSPGADELRLLGGLLGHLLARQRSEEQRVVAEAEADHLVADLRRLHELEVRLLASDDLAGMLEQMLEAAVELQGASAGVLRLYDSDHDDLHTVASVGFSEAYLEAVGRVPVGQGACGTAVAEQRAVVVADVTRDPLFAPYRRAAELGGYRSAYSLPLQTRGGQLLGTLATYFPGPHTPPERHRWLVALYAAQAAEAIRHSQLLEQARHAEAARDATLAKLRRHTAQLEGLNAAALAVTSCPTADDALTEVTRQARRLLGAHQAAASLVRGTDWTEARHTLDVSDKYAARDRVALPPDGTGLHALVCETNRPLRLTQNELAAHPRSRGLGHHPDEHPPVNGWLAAPLTAADGRNIGLLQLSHKDEGYFTAEDETLLVQLAQLASVAIRNAELLAERSQVAQTLQHSLLPPALPRVPGLQLAARFRPMNGAQVGGDFYDVFQLGRNDWAVVVGDVCGKGAQAASLTALVRYTIRAAAVATRRPADILSHLNEVMLRDAEGDEPRFATLAYVRLRLPSQRATATVACAGHPPPLLRRADATVTSIDAPGTLVGAINDVAFTQKTVRLRPGDTLLLYTDGITEARTHEGMFEDTLAATLAASPTSHADALLDHLDATLLAHATDTARDDIATLAIHRPHTPPPTANSSGQSQANRRVG